VNLVLEPLGYEFFVRGLLAAALVLVLGALAGPGVLARRQVYLGQGVGQAMLLGVALAAVSGVSSPLLVFISATTAALLAAGVVSFLQHRLESEVAIAATGSTMLALGVSVLSMQRDSAVNVSNLLFGNVLGVTWGDVLVLAITLGLAGGFFVFAARSLALLGVSHDVAVAHGVRVRRLEILQTVMVAASVASFVQVAGTLLAVAALVLPTSIAQLRSRSLVGVHALGVTAAVFASVLGLYVSYWKDVPSGPAITLVLAGLLGMVLVLPSPRR
jgi:ABC-type Mn2+/Zn2+ transport system permease subunit